MKREELNKIKKLLDLHKKPMWFNTGFPVLVITSSECAKLEKELEEMVDETI